MSFTIFSVNSVDYTSHLIPGSYNIGLKDVTATWVDGNVKTRPKVLRTRVAGSCKFLFRTPTEYDTFLSNMAAAKAADGSYTLKVHPNNSASTAAIQTISAQVDPDVKTVYGTQPYGYYPFGFEVTLNIEEN